MAKNRIKGITVEINGDVTGLDKALGKVNSRIKDTQSQLKEVERALKLDPTNTELLEQKQRLLAEAVKETSAKLATLKEAEKQAQEQFKNGEISQEQYEALQREIIKTENQLKNLEKQAAQSNATLAEISAAGGKFKEVGNKIEEVGNKLKIVSAAAAGLLTAAIKTTADFDSEMSKVSAVSGAVGDDFDALRDKAREMGEKTKFSAAEAAEAMNYMAMAGWKTEDMLNGIEGIMHLAAAAGEELGTTSDIVTDALTAFGLSAADSGHFADILAAASSNANTNVSMMGETFKYAAPVMGAMGYTAEDTALAIGLMANAGIKASSAGTTLRSIVTRMAKPTDEVSAAMSRLGIELYNEEGKMYSFRQIMVQMRESFGNINMSVEDFENALQQLNDNLDEGNITQKKYDKQLEELTLRAFGAEEAEKARAAAMLAGKNALSGLLAIVNASNEDFKKLASSIDNCEGTTEKMAGTMQDNLGGQLTILKSQLSELAISLGDLMMPIMREITSMAQRLTDKLNGMDEGTKKAIVTVLAIVAAAAPFLTILGKTITFIGSIMTFLPKIAGAVAALTPIISGVGSALSVVFATIAMNPMILVVTAIVAAVAAATAAIVKHLDEIKEAFKALGEKLKELWQGIKDFFAKSFDWVKENWQGLLLFIVNPIAGVFKLLYDNCEGFRSFVDNQLEKLKTAVKNAWEKIKGFFTDAVDFLKSLPQRALQWGKDLIQNFIDGIKARFEALKQKLSDVAQTVKDFLGFSEPKKGPLANFHTYAPDMMKLFAEGIRANEKLITDQITRSFAFAPMQLSGTVNAQAPAAMQSVGGKTVNLTINAPSIDNATVDYLIMRVNSELGAMT